MLSNELVHTERCIVLTLTLGVNGHLTLIRLRLSAGDLPRVDAGDRHAADADRQLYAHPRHHVQPQGAAQARQHLPRQPRVRRSRYVQTANSYGPVHTDRVSRFADVSWMP